MSRYLYIIIFFLILLAANFKSFGQEEKGPRIELVQANSFEFDKKIGNDVRRLIGDVIFKHQNYYMYCDSAYLYSEANVLDAYGKVRIRSGDTLNIYGDMLKYDGNNNIARIRKNVRMVDKQMTLTTNYLTYNLKTDIANYKDGGTLVDPENTLKSTIGYYYAGTKKFFFKDNVVLTNPEYTMTSDTLMYHTETETAFFYGPSYIVSKKNTIYCQSGYYNTKTDVSGFSQKVYVIDSTQRINADSIYYDRRMGESKAFNNITITNSDRNTLIAGDRAYYNEIKGILFITLKAQLMLIDKEDTLFLHSDTLKAVTVDSSKKQRNLFAYHKVRFFRDDLQGVCDSLVYDTKDSVINMFSKPALWADKNQMTADFIKMNIYNRRIKSIAFFNSSFIISQFDETRFDQIKGKDMIAWFKDNEIEKLDVKNNAEAVYYMSEDNGSLIGINKSSSPNMRIYIQDRKVHKVVHLEQTEGTLFPKKDFKQEDALLKDFKWLNSLRPKSKSDIF